MRYRLLLITILFLVLGGCAQKENDHLFEKYSQQKEENIYKEGEKLLKKGNYNRAAETFQNLIIVYPFGDYSEQGRINLAYSYFKDHEIDLALATINNYMQFYPRGKYIDYGHYLRGIIEYRYNRGVVERFLNIDFAKRDISSWERALHDFNMISTLYPRSLYINEAKKYIRIIENGIARHELYIAQFYFDYENYPQSIERALNVVNNYSFTPSYKEALQLIIDSHQQLQQYEEQAKYVAKLAKLKKS